MERNYIQSHRAAPNITSIIISLFTSHTRYTLGTQRPIPANGYFMFIRYFIYLFSKSWNIMKKAFFVTKKKWKINSKNCEKCVNVNSFNILQTTLLQFIMIFMSCLDVSRYWQFSAFGLILQLFRSRARTGHHHKISGPSLHCTLTCSTAESDYNSLLHYNLYWTHKMQYLHIAARGTWFSEFLLTFRQLSWSNKTVGFDLFLQYFVNIDQLSCDHNHSTSLTVLPAADIRPDNTGGQYQWQRPTNQRFLNEHDFNHFIKALACEALQTNACKAWSVTESWNEMKKNLQGFNFIY